MATGRRSGRANLSDYLERALQFRNYAEELRTIAADGRTPTVRQTLLIIAGDYDQMAFSLETMSKSKAALDHSKSQTETLPE
jgi:hypothetical protein